MFVGAVKSRSLASKSSIGHRPPRPCLLLERKTRRNGEAKTKEEGSGRDAGERDDLVGENGSPEEMTDEVATASIQTTRDPGPEIPGVLCTSYPPRRYRTPGDGGADEPGGRLFELDCA